MNKKYIVGEILDVSIKKLVPNGFGLAFTENLTVFVPLAVAGDQLRVRIFQLKGKTAFAEITEIIEPSPNRISPRCPHFGVCGGCNFQQMPYETQLEAKVGILRDSLVRIGKIELPGEIPIIPSPKPFEYRARTRWHADTREKTIGYLQRNSHQTIDVSECPILVPELQTQLSELQRNLVWEGLAGNILGIDAAAGSNGDVSIFSDEILEPTQEISYELNETKYFYNSTTFFQGNPFLIRELIEKAIGGASGEFALDLYCGVGLFALGLAEKFTKVIGAEGHERAVDFAKRNVRQAGFSNVRFFSETVDEFLAENLKSTEKPDFILLDPPRSGTGPETINHIVKLGPREISYVSCEPSILARDLRILTAGNYRIESIVAIDMFPQTHHVETVVRLTAI